MLAKLKSYWPLFLLFLGVLTLFWPAILHPDYILYPTFSPFSDTMVIHWPKAHLMAQTWSVGEGLPNWTPLILSGMPLAANQLAMRFYPPAWLFLILPIEPVLNILFVFHLLLGGVGVYLLLHESHKLSSGAALLGSLTFALNGKWLAHAAGGHVSMVGAIGWLPWVLWGTLMLLKSTTLRSRLKRAGLVAVILALQMTTHTLPLIYSVYLSAAAVVWRLAFIQTKGRLTAVKQLWLPLLLIPVFAVLLGAIQLLPLVELMQFSNRALSLSEAAEFALSPAQLLIGLLLPSANGGHEYVIYVGLIPLLLAPFGLTRRNRWTWFYGLLFILSVLFALGPHTPIHSLFYHLAPGFRWVRTPARMFFVGALAVAVLVGFAIDRLQHVRWSPTTVRWLARLFIVLSSLTLMLGLGLAFGFGQTNRAVFALAILVPLGLGLILLRIRRRISAQRFAALMALLLFLDLVSFDRSMMRFVSLDEALAPGQAAAAYLAQKPGPLRIYSPSYSLPMQTAAAAGLQLADGVEPVHLAIYDQYMARAGGYNDPSFSVTIPNFGDGKLETALQRTEPNLKLLGLLNVTYLVAAFPMAWPGLSPETVVDGAYIYRNEAALPRAWVAHQSLPAEPDWLTQLERLPNLLDVVILADETLGSQARGPSVDKPASPVTITHYAADRIELETDLTAPGWLVLSELWYPGWQVTVNGSAQPVARVNGLLRGVYLSRPGPYQITVTYRPASVARGAWISGITLGLMVLLGSVALFAGIKPKST